MVDFSVPADHRVKIKENETDLVRELKKLWSINVTVIPIEISALGTVSKGLVRGLEELEIRGQTVTIQTTALRLARILRRVLETWRDCCHSDSS